jgi:diaminopimelate decarboxylase
LLNAFHYRDGVLYCEGVELARLVRSTGTPCYVYSATAIVERYREYAEGLAGVPNRVFYAVKANGNLAVLRLLARAGAGFDIVSGGELYRVLKAGAEASSVVFSGVGKTREEIDYALEAGIHGFNCESEAELALISALATRQAKTARVALRVNPDVDAETHPYISTGLRQHKFGIDISEVEDVYARAARLPGLKLDGVSCHIGSQLLDAAPLEDAASKLLALVERLRARGIAIAALDLGGGIGVPYKPTDARPDVGAFLTRVKTLVAGRNLFLMFEPGRSIVAEAGALITRVLNRKQTAGKEFVIVDASMTELVRPALYQAHHEVVPLRQGGRARICADVVGPVCESGDFLAKDREMENVAPGDALAVLTAGAYGFSMASNYNARPRPCEVLVEGDAWRVVRRRETYDDLVRGEE